MVGASRMLRTTRALHSDNLPSSSSSSSFRLPPLRFPWSGGGEKWRTQNAPGWCQGRKKRVAMSLDTAISVCHDHKKQKPRGEEGILMENVDLSSLIAKLQGMVLGLLNSLEQLLLIAKYWKICTELLIEKSIISSQSFTLIAVGGSLIGSALCFVEGCFLVLESYLVYFQMVTKSIDHGEILHPLVEAIDLFLVGTALLTFGMGLYVMFIGSNELKKKNRWQIDESNFGLFNLKKLADSMEMQSISQAKSKVGHALLLLLQAGVVEKFKNVPLTSGLDLACFAGAVFISSACVFLLSKLTMRQRTISSDEHRLQNRISRKVDLQVG